MPRPPVRPARPPRRTARALGAALLLLGLVAGLPAALIAFAGNPLPERPPTLDGVREALTSPDDGGLFLSALAVLGWLAWASFAVSLLVEAYARVTRRAAPRLPGLGWQQRLAAGLLAALAAVPVATGVASAEAALVDPRPVTATAGLSVDPVPETAAPVAAPTEVVHVVQRGEGLLDLQDRYGVPWRRIAEANYDRPQPDGGSLHRGQSRIYPGWQLRIPLGQGPSPAQTAQVTPVNPTGPGAPATADPAAVDHAATDWAGPPPRTEPLSTPAAPPVYEVAEGDWMWHIAERYLGDPRRYPEIAELNPEHAARHGDYPDHIEPGWTLRLPPDAVDRGPLPHATGTATPEPPTASEVEAPPARGADSAPSAPAPAPTDAAPDDTTADADAAPAAPGAAAPADTTPADAPVAEAAPAQSARTDAAAAAPPAPTTGTGPAQTAPTGVAGFGEATAGDAPERAGAAATQDPRQDDRADDSIAELDRFAPATFAAAGLLAALTLGAAAYQWRRRHPYHRPGFRFTSPVARRLERSLRQARQPLDSERLTAALRALAAGLVDRRDPLPDVVGALVDEGTVHLLLASPCPGPPAPWQDHGDRWTLVAGAPLPEADGPLSPLPTLTAVGSQTGIHLLLDLERMGVLNLHGDRARTRNLLRYLAGELACNTWSDQVEVLLAGFPPEEAELLVSVNPDRVSVAPSVAEALWHARRRVESARATLRHTGAADALAGRVRGLAGDAWMPQVLLLADPVGEELDALARLARELSETGRCALAVAATGVPRDQPGQPVTVAADGTVQLRLPWVHATLSAASLSPAELADLATAMREARTAPPRPVPPAAEPEPWAAGTDAAGALLAAGVAAGATPAGAGTPAAGGADDVRGDVDPSPGPTVGDSHYFFFPEEAPAHRDPRVGPEDPDLDVDLRDWYAEDPGRPRIGVLGPVMVNAPGVPPETRRRLHAEVIVFLAQRGARGADAALLTSSLWPDTHVTDAALQRVVGRARRWLGTRPDGRPWLSDVDDQLTYRLADGYLFDWHLFRRLRTRAETNGELGEPDLRAALELVRGTPLDGADRAGAPGVRNPYPWLPESEIDPAHLVATVVDTAHQLAELCLARGDLDGVRWAVRQAWYVDVERGYDHPWRDLLRAEYAAGRMAEVRRLLAELMRLRDAEVPEDLAPETYELVRDWPVFAARR